MQASDSGKSVWKTLFPAAKIPQPPALFCNHKQPRRPSSSCEKKKKMQNVLWENVKSRLGIVAIKSLFSYFFFWWEMLSGINTEDSVRAKWGTLKITGWALANDYPPLPLTQRDSGAPSRWPTPNVTFTEQQISERSEVCTAGEQGCVSLRVSVPLKEIWPLMSTRTLLPPAALGKNKGTGRSRGASRTAHVQHQICESEQKKKSQWNSWMTLFWHEGTNDVWLWLSIVWCWQSCACV